MGKKRRWRHRRSKGWVVVGVLWVEGGGSVSSFNCQDLDRFCSICTSLAFSASAAPLNASKASIHSHRLSPARWHTGKSLKSIQIRLVRRGPLYSAHQSPHYCQGLTLRQLKRIVLSKSPAVYFICQMKMPHNVFCDSTQ